MAIHYGEPLSVNLVDDLAGPIDLGEPLKTSGLGGSGTLKWMTADEQTGLAPCPCGEDHVEA